MDVNGRSQKESNSVETGTEADEDISKNDNENVSFVIFFLLENVFIILKSSFAQTYLIKNGITNYFITGAFILKC